MKLSWKAPALLAAILLVALGLQAGAIKILLDLARPSEPEPVARESWSAPPSEPTAPPISAALEVERWSTAIDRPPNAHEPAMLADPPHSADLTAATQPAIPASVPEAAPSDPAPAPGPDAAALAMARLAELAKQTSNAAPAQPAELVDAATPEPIAAAPPSPAGLQEADWVRTRDPGRYTVQLYSGKDLERLKEVAATIGSDEPQAYYTTGSQTSPWYSLVLGDYPDSSTARAVAANLASSLQLKPWIRRFGDIQSSMR